jgi:hypothetical protein
MTEDEAKAIAEPLSSYLIRMEPTSKIAKQILDEYDIVAVFFAAMAYTVRVYMDVKKERDTHHGVKESGLEPLAERRPNRTLPEDGGRSDGTSETNSGAARYVGPISTPSSPGDGVLPKL